MKERPRNWFLKDFTSGSISLKKKASERILTKK